MKMVYQWKQTGRIKIAAQIVGERLERLRKQHGELTPSIVVADAADKKSPLHMAFEWDDKQAAAKWREAQAQFMIRMIVIRSSEDEDDLTTVRAFVSVRDEDDEHSYTHIHAAMSDPDMRDQVVRRAYSELQDWKTRYNNLREFAAVYAALEEVEV